MCHAFLRPDSHTALKVSFTQSSLEIPHKNTQVYVRLGDAEIYHTHTHA